MNVFFFILVNNILPVFLIIGFGYGLNKKFDLSINTLSKLNFYVFAPTFTLYQLYVTKIPLKMISVMGFAASLLVLNYLAVSVAARLRGYEQSLKNAMRNSVMFYNSGNFGIPLITLVFSSVPYVINGETPWLGIAVTTQVLILVTQSITTYSFGFFFAGRGNSNIKDSLKGVFVMPALYTVVIAIVLKMIDYDFTQLPVWPAITYIKDGMVSMALLTLGVQLSNTKFDFTNKDVYISNFLRLIAGPIMAYALIRVFGFSGIIAQALLISASVPTAVVTALIAVEKKNEPQFASQAVLTSTLFSCFTLSIVIYFSRILFPV